MDFIPLPAWQMKLVYWAMCHPNWSNWMPRRLRSGIHETRAFMLGGGYRLLAGDLNWNRRMQALQVAWRMPIMSAEQQAQHVNAFWTQAVWLCKKVARSEYRSAIHWTSKLMIDQVYPVLHEEARLAGRTPRPEARKAEQWLDESRLRQTAVTLAPDRRVLAQALLGAIDLFVDASAKVAAQGGFKPPNHTEVERWLRAELARMLQPAICDEVERVALNALEFAAAL